MPSDLSLLESVRELDNCRREGAQTELLVGATMLGRRRPRIALPSEGHSSMRYAIECYTVEVEEVGTLFDSNAKSVQVKNVEGISRVKCTEARQDDVDSQPCGGRTRSLVALPAPV